MDPVAPRRGFLLAYLQDFTANSNLHGLKYIGESSRSVLERIFWALVFVLSICTCGYLIKNLWTKWDQSPVIVSFGEKMTPVWQIPFPAITICPKNKIQGSKYNFTKLSVYYENDTLNEMEKVKFEDVSLLCAFPSDSERKYGNNSIMNNIMSVVPPSIFSYCGWRGKYTYCDMFSRVITHNGVCYSFNSLSESEIFRKENIQNKYAYSKETQHSSGWTMEKGYSRNTTFEVYPRRGRNLGSGPDLYVGLVGNKSEIDSLCDGPVSGYEVIIHNPAETSLKTLFHFEVKQEADITFAIDARMVSITENLRNYKPTSRQCYFPTERYLRYFNIYTQKNCEVECQSNFTFARCECVPFYLPHNDSNRICTSGSFNCIEESNEILAERLMILGGSEMESDATEVKEGQYEESEQDTIVKECSCLPTCTMVSYSAISTVATNDNLRNFAKAVFPGAEDIFIKELTEMPNSGLSFYFKETQYVSMSRSELYGRTDFLANCGGLLGLFLGFSVLSVVEIFYFMTFRLFGVIRKSRLSKVAADQERKRQE